MPIRSIRFFLPIIDELKYAHLDNSYLCYGRNLRLPPDRFVKKPRDRFRQPRDKVGNWLQALILTPVNVENDTAVERLDLGPMSFGDIAGASEKDGVPAGVEFCGRSLDREDKPHRIIDWADCGLFRGGYGCAFYIFIHAHRT